MTFAPARRGGSGSPMVCLHGFIDNLRTWDLLAPALEAEHDVLALALPGHAGGVELPEGAGTDFMLEALERAMDDAVAAHADALVAAPAGRRQSTALITTHYEHIPAELLAHQIRAVAVTDGARALIATARRDGWSVDAEAISCPVRMVWGTADQVLPWPTAAARYREQFRWADWVEMEGIGHCPQLDVPAETAQLILGFTED